jgi:hypothetical protein
MVRLILEGRSPRVLRPEELASSLWPLVLAPETAPGGRLDVEWLSPGGLVLERRAFASLAELSQALLG